MRADGVAEKYCTGDAGDYEKFLAWARVVPRTLRNPLYHWTHLELKRYFGIDDLLDEKTAPSIWKRANEQLASDGLTAHGILAKFSVRAVCTTDDPADSLEHHQRIAASNLATRVYPTFRPDAVLNVHLPVDWNFWIDKIGATANVEIRKLADLLTSIRKRHDEFHALGCRLSDHGLDHCYADLCSEREAAAIFDTARSGRAVTPEERSRFAGFMMLYFGRLDAEKGWTKQMHLGARRNANSRMRQQVGRDAGYDCVGDWPQGEALVSYLDRLDQENALPKMVIYNLNPRDNYLFATIAGSFSDGSTAGKIQFGSGWWFLDQKEAIEWQINALSNTGLLSRFIGMVTDSRSFLSYPRHEYFRRVLCNMLGADIEAGLLPADESLAGRLIEDVCFGNAAAFLGLGCVTSEKAGGRA